MADILELRKNFEKLIEADNLAQAYIFHGQDLKTQLDFAKKLIGFLEFGKWELSQKAFSDSWLVDGFKEGLGVEKARSFFGFLAQHPANGKKRILVVYGANNLKPQAQNALLKVSEEPASLALIILITKDPGVFLPALNSRFIKIYFDKNSEAVFQGEEGTGRIVKDFLSVNSREKASIIKSLVKEDGDVNAFVETLIVELNKKPIDNFMALKVLLNRYVAMNQFNVNKRLQLESVLEYLK